MLGGWVAEQMGDGGKLRTCLVRVVLHEWLLLHPCCMVPKLCGANRHATCGTRQTDLVSVVPIAVQARMRSAASAARCPPPGVWQRQLAAAACRCAQDCA